MSEVCGDVCVYVYVCVSVYVRVYVCVCYLQVYFALQLSCAVFPEIVRKVRSFPLYNSAQHTMCHLRAFSSQMSLCLQ